MRQGGTSEERGKGAKYRARSVPRPPRREREPREGWDALLSLYLVTKSRDLTPSTDLDADTSTSRRVGARHGVSLRVALKAQSGEVLTGWTLNVSRGGVRVMLDVKVDLGSEFALTLSTGADPVTSCLGRVVWVQEEPDGVVCGIEFHDPVARGGDGQCP